MPTTDKLSRGPWESSPIDYADDCGHSFWIMDADDNYLAEIISRDKDEGRMATTEQQEANGRAMASAFLLVEIAERYLTEIEGLRKRLDHDLNHAEPMCWNQDGNEGVKLQKHIAELNNRGEFVRNILEWIAG